MVGFVYEALGSFRGLFSRNSTWVLFCVIVLGFLGSDEMIGISSFCRFWGLGESGYYSLVKFFRSSAWCLNALVFQWGAFVLAQNETIVVQGRAVLLGDHTYVPKDGRRMPGLVTLHQKSETQTKPSYFRGHCWGNIGLLVGTLTAPFCLPLAFAIHQGFIHIGKQTTAETSEPTLGPRIVQMAIDFAIKHHVPCVLILDAFFPSAPVFILAASIWSIELQQPLVTLIVKAKKNCVAYFQAQKPGQPLKYGLKVTLMELFDHQHMFSKCQCQVYGKLEQASFMAINLLWKPTGNLIRFVLALTSRGPIVLMCTDLNQNPLVAIQLYCARTRIEVMFDMLKNLIGAFQYRFWSKNMPPHSRKPKKNKNLKKPSSQTMPSVQSCWVAYERFVMLAAISLGLLQLVALKYTNSIWAHFNSFLRTRSRNLPSERTAKHVIRRLLITDILIYPPIAIMSKIHQYLLAQKRLTKPNPPPDKFHDTRL